MLQKVRLINYRSFESFAVNLPASACLVGPNNAGKSTILTALRLVDSMLRVAHARKASTRFRHNGITRVGHAISLAEFPSLKESLRHEFNNDETRLEVTWRGGNKLTAVWPPSDEYDDEPYGFFFLTLKGGGQPAGVAACRRDFARLGVVPILTPVDHSEAILSRDYVRSQVTSRLSSRHFRNQLELLRQEGSWQDFVAFCEPWLPDVSIDDLSSHDTGSARELDLYLREQGGRVAKEVIWAGDGIQVWLQILFHAFRLKGSDVLILDEPDVYLHADLQRRLIRLLESLDAQTIVATHSPEIIAESPKANVVWIDKTRRNAGALKDEALLEKLTNTLGSQFNLKLAKAMRSRVVLMVEGKDMRMLRKLSATLGAHHIANEDGVAVIQLQGYSNSPSVDPFRWMLNDFLNEAVTCHLLLDRDYRDDSTVTAVEQDFDAIGVRAHVWRRKELESYLLSPDAIARLSGAPVATVNRYLHEAVDLMGDDIFARMLDERLRSQVTAASHAVTVTTLFKSEFDASWADPEWRLVVAPPKQVLNGLNAALQAGGWRTVSFERVASALEAHEVPAELRGVLGAVEAAAAHNN